MYRAFHSIFVLALSHVWVVHLKSYLDSYTKGWMQIVFLHKRNMRKKLDAAAHPEEDSGRPI